MSGSDEEIKITKSMITFITIAILVLSSIVSVVAFSVGVNYKAEQSLTLIRECKTDIKENKEQLQENKKNIAVVNSQYDDIIRRLESIENKIDEK